MNIAVLVGTAFEKSAELERAISAINQVQNQYQLSFSTAAWIKDQTKNKVVDYDLVFKEKEKRLKEQPAIIVTQNPLKYDWAAYDKPNFYISTTAGRYTRYQAPPLKILLMHFIAGILGNLECHMTEEVSDSMIHQGAPIGCISDLCEEEDDYLISMRRAHICRKCKKIYAASGLSKNGLVAIEKILVYVKEEALKYDRKIPYDAFVSYSHKDKDFVNIVANLLESKRFKVWYDDFSILPGETIIEKLAQGVRSSRCFMVVLSPDAVKSKWCKSELAMAIDLALGANSKWKVKILPVLYKKCRVPIYLRPYKYADLQDSNFQKGIDEVWAALRIQKNTVKKKKV
jgi:TIR domain